MLAGCKWGDVFVYDPETGRLRNRIRRGGRALEGRFAESKHSNGGLTVIVGGRRYRAHRVIWEMEVGSIPDNHFVVHINGDQTNNRLGNLRLESRKSRVSRMYIERGLNHD